ncbi:MAG: hypothetical protein ACOYOA_00955 [Saprospiraceae bacterium]|jgi:hypothetical protein
MKYLFYSLLIYWVYQRFFAPLLNASTHQQEKRPTNETPQTKETEKPKKDVGEFIDYEEVE